VDAIPSDDGAVAAQPEPVNRSAATVGVVVVDHGSRRPEVNRAHERFVADYRGRVRHPVVEPAHMELAEPSIATAFDRCVAAGAGTVVVAPYFLWPGDHWHRDLPALTAEAASRHPDVHWMVAAPLGPDSVLMDLVDRRVAHCLAHAAGAAPECATCAGSGSCVLR
jgi:sirohydrochlorin ferrochelatase